MAISKEEERIREKALLTDGEIQNLPSLRRYLNRQHEAVTNFIHDTRSKEDVERANECVSAALSATNEAIKAQVDKLLKLVRIEADSQDLASAISINLGYLAVEIGELFDNYPENFNKTIPKLGEKLKEAGFVRCLSKEEK